MDSRFWCGSRASDLQTVAEGKNTVLAERVKASKEGRKERTWQMNDVLHPAMDENLLDSEKYKARVQEVEEQKYKTCEYAITES